MPTTDTFQVPAPLPAIDLDVTIPHSPADLDAAYAPAQALFQLEDASARIGDIADNHRRVWAPRLHSALHPARQALNTASGGSDLAATAVRRATRVLRDATRRYEDLVAQDATAAAHDAHTVVVAASAVVAAVSGVEAALTSRPAARVTADYEAVR